jgi:L-asparaginase
MAKKVVRSSSIAEARILIVYTGGTIGMVQDPKAGALKPFNFNRIISEIPELRKFNLEIDAISFRPVIDSSNMTPLLWEQLASIIREHYGRYDGFVILHGTDTLAYTASALSYMCEGLNKPVVFTGSQLPVREIRTDAPENLITAIEIASSRRGKKPAVPEVCVYFDYKLFRGNRVSKLSSSQFGAFHSPNYPLLAEAGVNINFREAYISRFGKGKFTVKGGFSADVGVLTLFPGMKKEWVRSCLSADGLRGIVLQSFGSGNATTAGWFLDEICGAVESGVVVLNTSQCPSGRVVQGKYATSKALRDIGVISGMDMTLEAAVTKMMFLLGRDIPLRSVKKQLETNLKGELTT